MATTKTDDSFVMDPHADLPFERDFEDWLGAETLSTVTWTIEHPLLLEKHDDTIAGDVARVWLRGLGVEGTAKVRCEFVTNTGRKDHRTWAVELYNR
jgi:hypothetical protein